MNLPVPPPNLNITNASSWRASLSLGFRRTERGSRLVRSEHNGPLYVQKPFYPEGPDCAHVYLLHPPGGMVSGDFLAISAHAEAHSHALITTPGAGRVYRARSDGLLQQQQVELTIDDDAVLEWMPLETILFPSSRARLQTNVRLGKNSRFIGWDIVSLGLPANEARLDDLGQTTHLKQGLRLYNQGRLIFNERLNLSPEQNSHLNAAAGFRGHPVHGLLVAGPFSAPLPDDLMSALRALCDNELAGVTLNGEILTVRYLGTCSEKARQLLVAAWSLVRPHLLQRPACAPRIWAT